MSPGRLAGRIVLCYWALTASAQGQRLADLYGRILDTSEAGIGDAAITVINDDTGFRRVSQSEPGGAYVVSSLDPGIYKITVRKEGFVSVMQFGVRLAGSAATRADFTLQVGSTRESIVVTGTAPMINQQDASTGAQFDLSDVEHLPLNGRGLLTLLELVPGSNVVPATRGEAGQFTTSGQRPNTNYFTVDGVSANIGVSAGGLPAQSTGGALPAISAFGSLDSMISTEAVQEFRLLTSTAVAEYGRLPGASIALSSRSGSNELHGSTALQYRHELASANDWFGNGAGYGRPALRFGELAQTFGGPLRRNRTFFFLSYEQISLRQPYVWQQAVPSLDARLAAPNWAKPVLSLFPAPQGTPQANGIAESVLQNVRPAGLHAGSARLDQAITRRASLFGRYNDSPSTNEFGSTTVNQLDLRSRSLTLGLNLRATARTILDLRVNESQSSAHSLWIESGTAGAAGCVLAQLPGELLNAPTECDALVRFSINGVGQLVSGREGDRLQRQFQITASAAAERGHHALKFGADFRRIAAVRRDATGTTGVLADTIDSLTGPQGLWIATTNPLSQSAMVKELSLWVQDTWQATARLSIAAGLRWEFSPAPLPITSQNFLAPSGGGFVSLSQPLWPLSFTNFAPRLGAAWRVTRDGHTVLRAGGGLYYDSSMSIATDIINGGPLSLSQYRSLGSAILQNTLNYGFMPGLSLPKVAQWNVSLERALGTHDVLSLGYVGSAGRDLIRREFGGAGSSVAQYLALTTNHGDSDYHALALQYRRRLSRGVESVASYTWSHSLDNDSSDAFLVWAGPAAGAVRDRGRSDFDLRQSLTASLGYQAPRRVGGWAIDAIGHLRTGFPITVIESEQTTGISLANAFRPDQVWGQPVWIADASVPGGKRINPAAFSLAAARVQGTLGRNSLSGFGMSQLDVALRREFKLGERRGIQLRIEAFNALNHPNFADPIKYMDSPVFGQSTSMLNMMLGTGSPGSGLAPILQTGGPRILQGSLRFHF